MTLILQCSEAKKSGLLPAKELYNSQLFRCQRKYAEASGLPWIIFSAKFGLVEPDTLLSAYDVRIQDRNSVTVEMLRTQLPKGRLVSLCGRAYNKRLERSGADIHWLLRGLGVGERKSWLLNNLNKPLCNKDLR